MELLITFGLFILTIVIIAAIKSSTSSEKRKVFKNNVYSYTAKTSLMSKSEEEFFNKLQQIVHERYYVFPQVHLSSLLDHRVKGQEWKFAFRHVNGKSVDYILCDKVTMRPTYAVELDDFTHDQRDRIDRDAEVERIFEEAKLPLVRFRDKNVSESEIIKAFTEAKPLIDY